MSTQLNLGNYDYFGKLIVKTFQEYMLDYERFSKYYKLLLEGLEQEQRDFLVAIFSRKLYMHNGQHFSNKDFTPEELIAQHHIKEALADKIQLEKGYFRYNDYLLPANKFRSWVFYYELGINILKNKEAIRNKDIIDAGACLGDSCLILNKLNPRKIYAFDPLQENQNLLTQTIQLNHLEEIVTPIPSGLGEAVGSLEIEGKTLNIDAIDNYVEKNNLEVGLIKIHVEGGELNVIKGAEQTIRKFKPVIISAVYHNAEQFFELKPLLESWNLGYKFRFEKHSPYEFIRGLQAICEVY